MTLGLAIERVAQRLHAALGTAAIVGTAQPISSDELPALVLYATDAVAVPAGIGNVPRPPRTTPLRVTSTIAIADPVLRFGGDTVPLLADGGRVLRLPHGALVHADGAPPPPPLGAADLQIAIDGADYAFTASAPGPNQFQHDAATAGALGYGDPEAAGLVRFAAPLAGTQLRATYFVGEWEVTVARYRGKLLIDVVGGAADVITALSDAVGAALGPGATDDLGIAYVLSPTAWGPIGLPEEPLRGGRRRTISFRFDIELETAVVPSGGGVITRVDVAVTNQSEPRKTETFSVARPQESP